VTVTDSQNCQAIGCVTVTGCAPPACDCQININANSSNCTVTATLTGTCSNYSTISIFDGCNGGTALVTGTNSVTWNATTDGPFQAVAGGSNGCNSLVSGCVGLNGCGCCPDPSLADIDLNSFVSNAGPNELTYLSALNLIFCDGTFISAGGSSSYCAPDIFGVLANNTSCSLGSITGFANSLIDINSFISSLNGCLPGPCGNVVVSYSNGVFSFSGNGCDCLNRVRIVTLSDEVNSSTCERIVNVSSDASFTYAGGSNNACCN